MFFSHELKHVLVLFKQSSFMNRNVSLKQILYCKVVSSQYQVICKWNTAIWTTDILIASANKLSSLITTTKGGFAQNPVTAYEPAYGQRQSSHMFRWPYSAECSRFEQLRAYLKLV